MEVSQRLDGRPSAASFGGNEDLLSNETGALCGNEDLHIDDSLGDQIVGYLESLRHGSISGQSNSQP